jgi:hypothetical protein
MNGLLEGGETVESGTGLEEVGPWGHALEGYNLSPAS